MRRPARRFAATLRLSALTMAVTTLASLADAADAPEGGDALSGDSTSDAVELVEFIYDDAPFPQCHAATIEETAGGLVASWFGGTHERHPDVCIWVARKATGATSWTTPELVFDGVQHADLRYPCWNPVLFAMPGGELLLFFKVGPSPRDWWGEVARSKDGGATWSEARRLPEEILGPIKNKPILRADGETLLCGSSTEHDGWRVHFEVTKDAGRTWERIGPVNDGETYGAIQPTILRYGDGRLQALSRSRESVVTEVWSSDGGATWGDMKALELPNPSSGIDGVTLADGRQLLVYNHTVRGGESPKSREMLNVALSKDGRAWSAALVLERQPGEHSYPAVIQAKDGRVHVLYTYHRRKVRHVVLDPSQLEGEPIRGGAWPGL